MTLVASSGTCCLFPAELTVVFREEPITVVPRQRVESFDWDDRLEKAQADRYMPVLNRLMGSGDR